MTDKYDPQENNPEIKALIDKAEKEAKENLKIYDDGPTYQAGKIWWEKKRILKEKYNIDWKTPQEMNPDIIYN